MCQALTAKVRGFCVGVDEGDSQVFWNVGIRPLENTVSRLRESDLHILLINHNKQLFDRIVYDHFVKFLVNFRSCRLRHAKEQQVSCKITSKETACHLLLFQQRSFFKEYGIFLSIPWHILYILLQIKWRNSWNWWFSEVSYDTGCVCCFVISIGYRLVITNHCVSLENCSRSRKFVRNYIRDVVP